MSKQITDEYIINCFWKNKICLFNRNKDKYYNEDIKNYLKYRFKYSESIYETLFCIKHNIDRDNKICPICNKGILKFTGMKNRGYFQRACCKKCQTKYRMLNTENTCLKKYGVKSVLALKSIHEKAKQTCIKNYGVEHPMKSEIIKEKQKQNNINKYGVPYLFQCNEIKEKIKQTCFDKYGVEYSAQVKNIRKKQEATNIKRYGSKNIFGSDYFKEGYYLLKTGDKKNLLNINSNIFNTDYFKKIVKEKREEIQNKRNITKIKNHTFNTSKPENKCYNILVEKYGIENVLRQYKSDVYPFQCDFYVVSKDLYIECNFHWTHNGHLYNKNSIKDIITKCKWNIKAKKSKFYTNALKTWT